MSSAKPTTRLALLLVPVCVFHLLVIVEEVLGKCGSRPVWVQLPGIPPFVTLALTDGRVCIANNANGYPIPGNVFYQAVLLTNGTVANISNCAAASPLHAAFNSTTYQVLQSPRLSDGEKGLFAAISNPAFGLRSIREPECVVTADDGNQSLVDPRSGPLYIGTLTDASANYYSNPGAYIPGVGFRNAWMMSSSNKFVLLYSTLQKTSTQSNIKQKYFACYEGFGPTGALLKNFTTIGSRTNCMMACLNSASCTLVTVAAATNQPFSSSTWINYNSLSSKRKLFARVPLECKLYRSSYFVGNAAANTTVCIKLIDY